MLRRIEPDSTEPVARRVFRELRHAIVTMQFQPGQPLSEQEVAGQLGVSRQPVREAFIKLSESGLVVIRPQRGTFVVKISAKQVMDARFVREAVELAVARKAGEGLPARAVAELETNLKAQREAAQSTNPAAFLELDEAFHRTIALGVDCEYAWRVVEETKAQMDRVRYLSLPQATPLDRLITQHEQIVEGIRARCPDAAEVAMRVHLREILNSLPELAQRFPDLFDSDSAPAEPIAESA
ncbi:GntR family transcriptional regulator (plasmid) [Azospirillum argentinense]|uniref:GntR family transcriptional regulator n=1 Tax=Azospirillum argentinense TaxID=2970906 RepID=A0A060DRU7_9PROT|nr:GntR family transcriptional regulator [Azospirillum argentinense]AIB15492.1 GntR family transcriptional regulator [Azospirillum argentinense]EZQ04274.1 GntR family transcriptional regulator [Azospirillum argentinense]KAA1057232.1 Transcriptional regulator, GntR family [Azospirillum argentinense]